MLPGGFTTNHLVFQNGKKWTRSWKLEDLFRSVDNVNSYRAHSRSYRNPTKNKQNKVHLWACWKGNIESNYSSDGHIFVLTAGTKNNWFLSKDCTRLGENKDQTCYCRDQAEF